MKCLTVRLPWPIAIFSGGKIIENRGFPTKYRGPLAIHASATMSRREYLECDEYCEERGFVLPNLTDVLKLRGLVLGTVELVDCVEHHPSEWFEGNYGWVLANPKRFKTPIPAKGQLGIWEWDGEVPL